MALPTGWQVRINRIMQDLDPNGNPTRVSIDFNLLDDSGAVAGGDTHIVPATAPVTSDAYKGNGTQTAFTTKKPPFGGGAVKVMVNGQEQTGATITTDANGTVTATLPTAPSAGDPTATPKVPPARVTLHYPVGPGLDLSSVATPDLAPLAAWGKTRVLVDRWGG